jgi:hypothetical protein
LIHALTGTTLFGVVALPAVGIELFMENLSHHCSPMIILMLKTAEFALVVVDLSLLLVFLIRTSINFARAIWAFKE